MVVPFPIAWTLTTHVRRQSSAFKHGQTVIDVLVEALRREGAQVVTSPSMGLQFECPGITGMSRWALLAPISSGTIDVTNGADGVTLTYTLRFVLTFFASLVFALIFAFLNVSGSPLKTGILVFSWFFFGNIAISLIRFPAFMRRVLSDGSPPNTSLERTREG